MTRREIRFIVVGLIAGLGVATVAFILWNRSAIGVTVTDAPVSHENHAEQAVQTPMDAAMQFSADEQRQVGVQTAEVQRRNITEQITAVGRIEEPETGIRTISARVGGRIDRLLVNFTGQPVKEGQPIAEIYSPEIVTAAEEYKLSLESRRDLDGTNQAAALVQAEALIAASRRRLELWGLTSEQIEVLVGSPETPVHLTIASSASGIIRTRNITEGEYVKAGDPLFDVIDLSTVWVEADIFQTDIGKIRPGLRAQITSDALPGTTLRGTVSFIKPKADPQNRTTSVRIQVDNPGIRLRPGMYVRSAFDISLGSNVLTVPRTSVIDTGAEKIVFLALPDGVFQRRAIQTGTPAQDYYPVLGGLSAGDTVVTHGAFLMDSQSRLTGGMTGLFGGSTSFAVPAANAGDYRINFRIEPDPPQAGRESKVRVRVENSAGSAVKDAQVRITLVMPAMPAMGMTEMRSGADLPWTGSDYTGPVGIPTAGSWNVTVDARRGNQILATYRTRFDAR